MHKTSDLQGLARGAHEIPQDGDVGAVRADPPGVDGKTETLGEIEIDSGVIEFGQAKTGGRCHPIQAGWVNRARWPVTLPGTARQFVKLFPIAFVPSVHLAL